MNICGHHWANKNNSNIPQPTNMTKLLSYVAEAELAPH